MTSSYLGYSSIFVKLYFYFEVLNFSPLIFVYRTKGVERFFSAFFSELLVQFLLPVYCIYKLTVLKTFKKF